MSKKRRTRALLALTAGFALVAAACGSDDDEPSASPAAEDTGGDTATTGGDTATTGGDTATTGGDTATTGGDTATTVGDPGTTTGDTGGDSTTPGSGSGTPSSGSAAAGGATMTITVDLVEEANWQDGSPITWADIECSWRAALNTPGSLLSGQGYDKVTAVTQGESEKQAVIEFSEVYGPYKTLFDRIIQASAVENCDDISGDFSTEQPISGREWVIDSWSAEQLILVPNPEYWGEKTPLAERAVMVPQVDQDTEIASIKAGQVDFISPQFTDTIASALDDPTIELGVDSGTNFEGFYFQQLEGPLADPVLREALSLSIDREAVFAQIYQPIFDAAEIEGELSNCGPWYPGEFCPDDAFQETYDPAAAEALLTENGWERDGEGFWAPEGGEAPEIRWMINAGNLRRENTQAFLIPLLAEAGFNVVPDNGTAEEVFQQRLPTLDYDMAMFIQTPKPDPGELTPQYTCDQIPSEENDFQGANQVGWCNEEATAAWYEADVTADPEARAELVKTAIRLMDTDHVMLPLAAYPNSGAWRTDRVGGPVGDEITNARSFQNFWNWEDLDGDGQIVIGAEQWPGCLNPVTECANSSWSLYTVVYPVLPSLWDTTAEQTFEPSELVAGEPTVETSE